MKRALALTLVGAAVLAPGGAALSTGQSSAAWESCDAARVHGRMVRAGPFKGIVIPKYDVVGGRFRLHVGPYRDRATGIRQKIGWTLPLRYKASSWLQVTGVRLHDDPHPRVFRHRAAQAGTAGARGREYLFPSTIAPPVAGCWHLGFRVGNVKGALIVWVHGRG